jgi:serine/threonine protein kinase
MTDTPGEATPPSERSPRRPDQDKGSTVSMASTTTGLPDRYRPLDQVGPDEVTPTGVIQCWRAKDRVLNRDVAIRVHTPAGEAAHAWISRALTAGGLATPALAMVYDASQGGGVGGSGGGAEPGGAAYVVNEWIDGETLTERLTRGPLPDREVRTVLRRLAEGVAEAHRVGLAVGGLTPDNVVLRPNGLVGLRAVPAATGSIDGDITALGSLLEACLCGLAPGGTSGTRPLAGAPDLVALARRARSTDPGQGLSSVAAMAALLAERPRTGPHAGTPLQRPEESDSGWLRRLRERRSDAAPAAVGAGVSGAGDAPVRLDPQTFPPVPPVQPLGTAQPALPPAALGGDTIDAGSVAPSAGAYAGTAYPAVPRAGAPADGWSDGYEDELGVLTTGADAFPGYADDDAPVEAGTEDDRTRRRLVVVGLPLLALAVVIALAWWVGTNVLSVAGSVDDVEGSTPSASAPADGSQSAAPGAGTPAAIVNGEVFDPEGDGEPENDPDVPLSFDDDPATAWSTLEYRSSPAFGNLKSGVGVVYDLGTEQSLTGVVLTSTAPGATVEIRTGDGPDGALDDFTVAGSGTVGDGTEIAFDEPVETRYLLVWITGLVPSANGFSADLAEVVPQAAG